MGLRGENRRVEENKEEYKERGTKMIWMRLENEKQRKEVIKEKRNLK